MSDTDDIIASQSAFFQKADRNREEKFRRLLLVLKSPVWIAVALDQVLRSQGARTAGTDGKTRDDFQTAEQRQRLADDVGEFLGGHYFLPSDMLAIRKKKPSKPGWRTILVPTIRDRVSGELLKMALEPIFEADFLPCSRGYRPGIGRMDAISDCRRFINADRLWVVRMDIQNCFPSIDSERLMSLVERRIADKKIIDLVWAFLDAHALEHGFEIELMPGVPAGFPLAPLLMNIYLHEADAWFARRFRPSFSTDNESRPTSWLVRYADNFLIATEREEGAFRIRDELTNYLEHHLHSKLSQSEICNASEGFDFLGFNLRRDANSGRLRIRASGERVLRIKQQIGEIVRTTGDYNEMIQAVNQAISSFGNEFRFVDSASQFRMLDHWIERKVACRALHRQSKSNGLTTLRRLLDINQGKYQPTAKSLYASRSNLRGG